MESIAISEFKASCLRRLEKIRQTGESLLVTKKGIPIAVVSPAPLPVKKRQFGAMKSKGKILGDLLEPLDDISWDVLRS